MKSTNSILYIDDDSDDCIFLTQSLADTGSNTNLVCVNDGEEAVKYLNSIDADKLPSLIVLDLNMPRWDGKQTLKTIKSHSHLAAIPVVILSTSDNRVEKEKCAQLGAASFIKKPFHYDDYKTIASNFKTFMEAS